MYSAKSISKRCELRVAEDAELACRPLLKGRNLDRLEDDVGFAPRLPQRLDRLVLRPRPLRKGLAKGLLEARHDPLPGVIVEPLAGALRADVIAEHVVAVLVLEVSQEEAQGGGGVAPPEL